MIFLYLLVGLISSIIGALPLGASNIAVINTTLKQNAKQALKIAFAAGIAEVILSYFALHCNMIVKDFFDTNMWLQIVISIVLLGVGVFLFFKSKRKESTSNQKKNKLLKSKFALGFILGLLNPPVLIYWLLVYGVINNNDLMLSIKSPLLVLFLFFTGVYFGKLLTLYLYSKFSQAMSNKYNNINKIISKVTGALLVVIGIVQMAKVYLA